ncbi:MAG: hypothetical protein KBT47_02475 [Armatimonadetes bacterium]|nr:hypothetical protein [Candidatus Hippobium faecium]
MYVFNESIYKPPHNGGTNMTYTDGHAKYWKVPQTGQIEWAYELLIDILLGLQ